MCNHLYAKFLQSTLTSASNAISEKNNVNILLIHLCDLFCRKLYLFNASVEFRSKFMYNNLMYGLVSGMSEYLGGDTWENLMTDHIFKPLDMDRTTFTHTVNFSKVKYATPHMIDSDTGKIRMVSMEFHRYCA